MKTFNLKTLILNLFLISMVGCQTIQEPEVVKDDTPQAQPISHTETTVKEVKDPLKDLYELALWSSKQNQLDDAIKYYQQIIAEDAQYAHAALNLGIAFYQQEKFNRAQKAFEKALSVSTKKDIAYNYLAIIERKKGNFQKAKDLYLMALNHNKDFANAHLNLAILYDLYLQQLESALNHYQTYQQLVETEDDTIKKWIDDLNRRIKAEAQS